MRVVDDLTGEIDLTIRKLLPGLICIVYGSLDAVAETKLTGQPDGRAGRFKAEVPLPQEVNETTVIVTGKLRLYFGLEAKALPEVHVVPARLLLQGGGI
jgi:hypothetical protein